MSFPESFASARANRSYATNSVGTATLPPSFIPTAVAGAAAMGAFPGGGAGGKVAPAAVRSLPTVLRGYQARIAAAAAERNTIVMLPTGTGKTLIAAEVIKRVGTPAVFLVPTTLLVEQQAAAVSHWTHLRVAQYYGGLTPPSAFDVLVTTPQAFLVAQRGWHGPEVAARFAWGAFRVVAFDEVHHILKDHPYRKLATALRRSGASPRLLGLSASLTYRIDKSGVATAVRRLCSELGDAALQTATLEELTADGFRGGAPAAADVKPAPEWEEPAGIVPQAERKPHLMLPTFLGRVKSGTATPFAAALVRAVRAMEATLGFKSPIDSGVGMGDWGAEVHERGLGSPQFAQLEHYYEALRLVANSWEVSADAATAYLRMFGADEASALAAWSASPPARDALAAFWDCVPAESPRFNRLCDALREKLDEWGPAFRGIVFVEMRVMAHVLEHVIGDMLPELNTTCLYATSAPASASLRLTRAEAMAHVADFASGRVNLLIATRTAEEGFDIPAANCVFRFDPIDHSVSYVQGRGRARAEGSSYTILAERADRPASMLAAAETQQLAIIASMQTPAGGAEAGGDGGRATWEAAERTAQLSRERNAAAKLPVTLGLEVQHSIALAELNLFCKRTKVELAEAVTAAPGGVAGNLVSMEYSSCLRTVRGEGQGATLKAARQAAAANLLARLAASLAAGAAAGASKAASAAAVPLRTV